eukprot:g2380.t1
MVDVLQTWLSQTESTVASLTGIEDALVVNKITLSIAAVALFLLLGTVFRVVSRICCGVGGGRGLGGAVGSGKPAILLLGCSGSGKTALFQQLIEGKLRETVTSMESREVNCRVHPKFGGGGNTISSGKVGLLDFPGHLRLRHGMAKELERAKAIIVVLDCSDASPKGTRNACELLAEVFTNEAFVDHSPPMLIMCNKSDMVSAPEAEIVQSTKARLNEELELLKGTRSLLQSTADDEVNENQIMLGSELKFNIDRDAGTELSFCVGSAKTGDFAGVVDFISEHC